MTVRIRLLGADKVLKAMDEIAPRAEQALGAGLYLAGNNIMTASKEVVPVGETGNLRDSGYVTLPEISRGKVTVELGYGGPAAAYCVPQHEHTEYRHDAGQQAKYLEQPLNEAAGSFAHDVAAFARAAFEANRGASPTGMPQTPWEGGTE